MAPWAPKVCSEMTQSGEDVRAVKACLKGFQNRGVGRLGQKGLALAALVVKTGSDRMRRAGVNALAESDHNCAGATIENQKLLNI